MNITHLLKITAFIFATLFLNVIHAAVIYPIDKAEILASSKFDIKVEFNHVVNPNEVVITVNGMPANKLIVVKSEF